MAASTLNLEPAYQKRATVHSSEGAYLKRETMHNSAGDQQHQRREKAVHSSAEETNKLTSNSAEEKKRRWIEMVVGEGGGVA